MKNIIFTFLIFITTLFTVSAQQGINFSHMYAAGGKLLMCVDSSAKSVYYNNKFPNQPNTSFNYLPEVDNVSIEIYFRESDRVQNYLYTILVDNKPIAVNKSINEEQLREEDRGDGEILHTTTLGIFPIKGKTITTLLYNIEKPLDIDKSVFYGKPIPRAKIKLFSRHFDADRGFGYNQKTASNVRTNIIFTEKDDEIAIVKDRSDIDYLYSTSILDKQTNKIIFESTSWRYDYYVGAQGNLPHVNIDKAIFKKSGNYEIIIQPLINWHTSPPKDIEKYTTRHKLSITLDQENYTRKELVLYTLIIVFFVGLIFFVAFYFSKKASKKKMAEKEQQKNMAKLQLNSIRSQLNPHFLFNALSGIQNLMNKNEIDNANKYLSKFARLTRHVLDDKELISLSQEKKLLDDYLQMEQLRFGFKYEINHSEELDLDHIEIPSMLLQPFVENAVKHGIQQKASDGEVLIVFSQQSNGLILTVADNGNGFDTNKKQNGLGLQLSASRITLLNSIFKENRFSLSITSNANGTKISLTLTDWL